MARTPLPLGKHWRESEFANTPITQCLRRRRQTTVGPSNSAEGSDRTGFPLWAIDPLLDMR